MPVALCAVLAGLAGCGATDTAAGNNRVSGDTLTIYSSVPLHGASAVSGRAVIGGERIALQQVGGRVGRYRVVLRVLDDSTAQRGEWDPGQTTLDVRQAVRDRTTIGYIGELNSGASAISIPPLNRVGIPQISPTSTAVGLTQDAPGASPGEPQKYYPTGVRTFARVIPNDSVQAAAMVRLQVSHGCAKTYVLEDGEVDGEAAAVTFELAARSAPLQVVAVQMFDPKASSYSSLALSVAQTGANCVLISALTENNAALLTEQVAAALPHALLFAFDGMAESTYTDPAQGGIPIALDPRVLLTIPGLGAAAEQPSARAFSSTFTRQYGRPQPAAVFGFEAMNLMLSAIARATNGGRSAVQRSNVLAAIFATRNRHSLIGTYSIDRNGDTTLSRVGVYRVVDGQLMLWKTLDV